MEQVVTMRAHKALFLNTSAFTICFAAWMLNGVLVTFLIGNRVYTWSPVAVGWLIGIPVLSGSLLRLLTGMLTDKFGGKPIFCSLLLISAIPMYLLSTTDSLLGYALCSAGFGIAGASFSVGIAYTSVWYPQKWQGTALGIFGAGNAGSALTTLFAPTLLNKFTDNGANLEGWRQLPVLYSALLAGMGILILLLADNKKPDKKGLTLVEQLVPLKDIRVWRFGLYYFLVFGCFVAFAQWLVPYFVNVYSLSLVTAGLLASMFSFPSGVIRAIGGWLSDHFGARQVMYWVLGLSCVFSFLLIVPKMDVYSPGAGVMANRPGTVAEVTDAYIKVDDQRYEYQGEDGSGAALEATKLIFPAKLNWQEPIVEVGQKVKRNEVLARGVTRIHFQAHVWVFTAFVIILGTAWGIGKAAVYKHIPNYFPHGVGVVGGIVGVIGGLGGFVCPIIFAYLLQWTGLWTSCWMLMWVISVVCLIWMHQVIQKMMRDAAPQAIQHFDKVDAEDLAEAETQY